MEIAPGIQSLSREKGGHVHGYLLDDGQGLTLIDTLYDDDANVVRAEILAAGHGEPLTRDAPPKLREMPAAQ